MEHISQDQNRYRMLTNETEASARAFFAALPVAPGIGKDVVARQALTLISAGLKPLEALRFLTKVVAAVSDLHNAVDQLHHMVQLYARHHAKDGRLPSSSEIIFRLEQSRPPIMAPSTPLPARYMDFARNYSEGQTISGKEIPLIDDIGRQVTHMITVREAIRAKHGKKKPAQFIEETMPCPVCGSGTVSYCISPGNGHIGAQCSTPNCCSFQE